MISFRMAWLDLLAVQGTLKSLLQHHSSVLQSSAFFTSINPYMTTGKTTVLTRRTFVGKVMSLLLNMLPRLVIACLLQGRGTERSSACVGRFEGGCHYLPYLHHSLASGQTTGREHSPTHQQKIGSKICRAWHCSIRTRPSFPLSQSLPSESFHKPLILIHQRADRMKITITEN